MTFTYKIFINSNEDLELVSRFKKAFPNGECPLNEESVARLLAYGVTPDHIAVRLWPQASPRMAAYDVGRGPAMEECSRRERDAFQQMNAQEITTEGYECLHAAAVAEYHNATVKALVQASIVTPDSRYEEPPFFAVLFPNQTVYGCHTPLVEYGLRASNCVGLPNTEVFYDVDQLHARTRLKEILEGVKRDFGMG